MEAEGSNNGVNSGVHATNGFEFQKHCCLYILFKDLASIRNQKYFICLEHHDDFLFCFLDENNTVLNVDAFQSKKASADWTLKKLGEPIKKMTSVGVALKSDSINKSEDYYHSLKFVTNKDIELKVKVRNVPFIKNVNVSENELKFVDLGNELAAKIKSELSGLINGTDEEKNNHFEELNNVCFSFIDLPMGIQQQKDTLVGIFGRIFQNDVADHRAAVETLLLLFRDVENVLNQGNVSRLLDQSKRIESAAIERALNIITSKQMAYQLWRDDKQRICSSLQIVVADQTQFNLNFDNSLDLFKDLTQVEHQKILSFVKQNPQIRNQHFTEVDCINAYHQSFIEQKQTQLTQLELKAAIFAAYIETKS